MTTVLFPIGGAPGAVQLHLNALTSLAPRVDRMVRGENVAGLVRLLKRHDLPVSLRAEAVRQLEIGFSLFKAFESYARYLQGERRSRRSPTSVEEIERAAEETDSMGFEMALAFAKSYPEFLAEEFSKQIAAARPDRALRVFETAIVRIGTGRVASRTWSRMVSDLSDGIVFDLGLHDQIIPLLEELKKASLKIKNPAERCFAVECVAFGLAKAGHGELAAQVCGEAADLAPFSRSYFFGEGLVHGLILRTMKICGPHELTADAYDRLKRPVRSLPDPFVRAYSFERMAGSTWDGLMTLAHGDEHAEDFDRGLDLYGEAIAALKECRRSQRTEDLVQDVLSGLLVVADAGYIDRASALAEDLKPLAQALMKGEARDILLAEISTRFYSSKHAAVTSPKVWILP